MDRGEPISYLVLREGTPVETADGHRLGTVKRVLFDDATDIFDGLVVDTGAGERFVDAPEVADLHERLVVLALGVEQARHLREPEDNPTAMSATPADVVADSAGDRISGGLRRVWNLISGKG
ncbi:MAG: PRC-barrel domain-containing protein [Solirubrobacterales bacterium]|nr:PRC-barrel domain-containing protein [Solirubrobacterales bacterium]